jgi:hypothetical protein
MTTTTNQERDEAMRETIRQYTHLVAIWLLVIGPAWGFHPIFGMVVTWFALTAWAVLSPITAFDVAIGNAIIAGTHRVWQAFPHRSPTNQEHGEG